MEEKKTYISAKNKVSKASVQKDSAVFSSKKQMPAHPQARPKPRPTPKPKVKEDVFTGHDSNDEQMYSGVSLNEILNPNKKVEVQDDEYSYANTLINDIKKKHEKQAKRSKMIMGVIMVVLLVAIILLIIFVPEFSRIVDFN